MTPQLIQPEETDLLREVVFGLRIESWKSVGVLRDGSFPADVCEDEHDEHAMHWVVRDGGRLIAAARMCVHDDVRSLPDAGFFIGVGIDPPAPIASLNRLVVHPEYQRHGLSHTLDQIRIRQAREIGCRSIWCVAPPIRWAPLQRQGFTIVAPVNLASPPRWIEAIQASRAPDAPEIPRKVMALSL